MRGLLFRFLMWLSRKERRAYTDGYELGSYDRQSKERQSYDHGYEDGWHACLIDTDKRKVAYPITAYAPLEQECTTDKVQRPMLTYLDAQRAGAGLHTAMERAIPRQSHPTVKLSPDRDRR